MPTKPPVLCRANGCRNATTNADALCDVCREQGVRTKSHKVGDPFYWSTPWLKFKRWRKRQNPLCEKCIKFGRLTPTDVVDHIVEIKDGGARLSTQNTECLCYSCHAKKTAFEKKKREGRVVSPPTPPVQPFGSLSLPGAELEGGGITMEGHHGKR